MITIDSGGTPLSSPNEPNTGSQPPTSPTGHPEKAFIDDTVTNVRASRKYKDVDPAFIARIVLDELGKNTPPRDVEERVRTKLHQVGGAFFIGETKFNRDLERIRQAAASEEPQQWKDACAKAMRGHASTAERLTIINQFYGTILGRIEGPISSVLDLACGLNPLAIPWMGLRADVKYRCCDIYGRTVLFLNDYFKISKIDGYAEICDLTASVPTAPVDVAFVLKTIPTLERIDRSAGLRLLQGIQAEYLVVSFPSKTLGGREKGMAANYEARFKALVDPLGWRYEQFLFENELVFLVRKN
jgi:16S rRNA (guanine(1405)-N(7))-methyltransferase